MAKLSELADHLGISTTRVSQLKSARILPDAPHGKHDLDACRASYLEHLREVAAGRMAKDGSGFDLVTERARLAAAQAERVERENAVAEGKYLEVATFHLMMTSAFSRVRSRLLALPSKLAPLVAPAMTSSAAQATLKSAVYEALDELAATRVAGITEDGEIIDDPEAAQ